MKYPKNNWHIRLRKKVLLSLAVVLILTGIGMTTVNISKLAQGYYSYHTDGLLSRITEASESGMDDTSQINKPGLSSDTGINTAGAASSDVIASQNASITDDTPQVLYPERPGTGDDIGELYIPALKAEIPVYEGTGAKELNKGVGHFEDSALPGEDDNCVLSGHRDTVFRELGKVEKGDLLLIRTSAGEFEYKVNKIRIVDKDDRTVIVPKPRAVLTITTCYPFTYIGSAPKRYILEAYLVKKIEVQ